MQSVFDIDFALLTNRHFHPSPAAWEDQTLYFFMLDRFSDGRETDYVGNDGFLVTGPGTVRYFAPNDFDSAVGSGAAAAAWRDAGGRFVGGTLKGATSKIGYLARLGITAIWVSPVFKQPPWAESYHGYGVQDFLAVEPRFGSSDDLRDLVATAHAHGIHVILDIILNHTGPVFDYDPDRYPTDSGFDPRWDGGAYEVKGWRDAAGGATLPFPQTTADPDAAVWPRELQQADAFTRKGRIDNWDYAPEFLEGDFLDLKDVHLGVGSIDHYAVSPALRALVRAYQYWIAFADIDGFRIDTVKHMDPGAVRYFTACIHEFAQSIGKEHFILIGEITGGRGNAFALREATGLDAALGIDDIPDKLEYLAKGHRNPSDYFDLFRNSYELGKDSHVWFRDKVVTLYDDHDQVRKGPHKARFAADGGAPFALNAMVLNALTLGIPCIYYGSEQGFDGAGDNDRYIRETMFGGDFGAFRSTDRHAFDETLPLFRSVAALLAVRRSSLALRRGRQYLREISGDGHSFGLPAMVGGQIRSVVAWSRLFLDQEWLCAINTDSGGARAAWVNVDAGLSPPGRRLVCRYASDPALVGTSLTVVLVAGRSAVWLDLPAAGCVVCGPD
ncbi:alpha-amylase family glycosyl hydrolase [Ideonella sp. A 288]|uniref:alpha-amylase family glycosyl hydrolase n=1 Tax=Ideonella sp. A 288 TaxID=1962181 RepID=UPI000B4A662E|nr:alpha-amylase family glycosyl hydrolase [Ideonella sp. A 288]